MDNASDRQTEVFVDRPHPVGITAGEIIIDGNDVDAFTGQGVEVNRQGRHQGLALTGFHLGNFTLVQNDATDQLHIEMTHAESSFRRLAHDRKCLRQEVIEGFTGGQTLLELSCFRLEVIVGECLELYLEAVNLVNLRLHPLQVAFILAANNLLNNISNHYLLQKFQPDRNPGDIVAKTWNFSIG